MTEQPPLRIVVGADDAGEQMKNVLRDMLRADPRVAEVIDIGVNDGDTTAYPHIGHEAAVRVANGEANRALLVCGTGMGVAMAANKVRGIRASVAHDSFSVERLVKSNDAQVLAMGARVIGIELAKKLVSEWLDHRFDPTSRSKAKVDAMSDYETA
jgi:ribose 5-phosphate isomerase B